MKKYTKLKSFVDIKNFLYGGNSTITLKSGQTGNHYTYKVSISDNNEIFFVSVLSGSDNTTNYSYIGIIIKNKRFILTKKSKVSADSISFKAFDYFYKQILSGKISNKLEVLHSGTCAKCGRKLTTPESIKSGFGPICITKINS
jgi:hypothetical protein